MEPRVLECTVCTKTYSWRRLINTCECGKPLQVLYDLERISERFQPERTKGRVPSMWRYREVLPLPDDGEPVSLGEGWTPLLSVPELGRRYGIPHLYLKDESQNPTGSFKARGMSMAVSMARYLGARELVVPSAGNAAGALSAYAARAGLRAHVFMPVDTPRTNILECRLAGADVHLVNGLITDCGKRVAELKEKHGWFDVSTLKEPYRVEGKKTMGYEIFEQLGGLPDAILYPTGGGTGLIGMWKSFDEMEAMGWIGKERPKMVAVQAEGCNPIVRAFEQGLDHGVDIESPHTIASGLRVPKALGDYWILRILRESNGTAVSVSDDAIRRAVKELYECEGIFACPEGAACIAAIPVLKDRGFFDGMDRVVIFNTGTGLKYLDVPGIDENI